MRGKGHLHSSIAGRKDNLRRISLRKDNPETTNKILVYWKSLRFISKFQDVRKLGKSVRKFGRSVRKLRKSVRKLGKSVRKLGKSVRKLVKSVRELGKSVMELGN